MVDDFKAKEVIHKLIKEICHYSQMQVFATSSYQKKYFQNMIDNDVMDLFNLYLVGRDEESNNKSEESASLEPPSL